MRVDENILYLENSIDFSDIDELIKLSKDVDSIVLDSSDIHPAIVQLLLNISNSKTIEVDDSFYNRFFTNLKLTG